jgi:hypothetical protein
VPPPTHEPDLPSESGPSSKTIFRASSNPFSCLAPTVTHVKYPPSSLWRHGRAPDGVGGTSGGFPLTTNPPLALTDPHTANALRVLEGSIASAR